MAQIIESPHTLEIPATDIASFVFSSGTPEGRQAPQYFDAGSPSRCYSLAQTEVFVKRISKGLQDLGLQPDDKVLLFSSNSLYFPVLFWGVVAARCVFTSVNPGASETELAYQLRDSDAKVLLAHPSGMETALAAARRVGLPASRIFSFVDPESGVASTTAPRPWTDFWCSPESVANWHWHRITSLEEAQSTTAVLNYSSGTTGTPKGVEISHYNAVANCLQLVHKRSLVGNTEAARARKHRLDTSGERWLAPLPMYHAYGQTYYCMNAARLGAKVYIMSKYNLAKLLLYVDTYRITFLTVVPVIVNMMARYPHPTQYNLKAVESAVCGSAPLNPELAEQVARLYLRAGVGIKQGLGMTECTCSLTQFAPDDEDDGCSVGWLNANCRAQIRPIDGEDFTGSGAPQGVTVGEIWVSGPNIMKGYYKRPQHTEESIYLDSEGVRWLRTGDIGYVDERGRFYLVDRMKDLIKVKGMQVSPAELELAILEHPDVSEAAVVGAKRLDGEYPQAFVVRRLGTVTEQEIQRLIESRFARHKWLTAGVQFVDAIPRTASGKIIRRALRDAHKAKI